MITNRLLVRVACLPATVLVTLSQPLSGAWAQRTAPASASASAPVRIAGSSTVFPLVQLAVQEYRSEGEGSGTAIELRETGTSAGLREFCRGRIPIANASRPINSRELRLCAARGVLFIELPLAFDALTVVVNPRNSWARSISLPELSTLWNRKAQGTVNRWRQVNPAWPDRPIRLCGPGQDSGTFDYFNKAVNGSETDSRRDFTSSEDDMVLVRCVAADPGALGYFGFSWARANPTRVRPLAIAGPKGTVFPSLETVQNERYVPLSRPLFVYVSDKALREQAEVRRFVTFMVRDGLELSRRAGLIPLPPSTYRLAESKLYRHLLGTSFGGDLPVGLTIGEALRRSFDRVKRPQYR